MKPLFRGHHYVTIALFFFLLQVLIGYTYFHVEQPLYFLWFCNHTPLLLGLAFLFHKIELVKALLNTGFFLQLLWSFDFFSAFFFGISLFHVTEYMFMDITSFSFIGSLLTHILSPSIALGFSVSQPQRRKILFYSAGYLFILYLLTVGLAPSGTNYNLINYLPLPLGEFTFPGYTLLWPLIAFVVIVLPSHYFQKWLYHLFLKRQ